MDPSQSLRSKPPAAVGMPPPVPPPQQSKPPAQEPPIQILVKELPHEDELVEDALCEGLHQAGILDEHYVALDEKTIKKPLLKPTPQTLNKVYATLNDDLLFPIPATAPHPAYTVPVKYGLVMYAFQVVRSLSFTPIKHIFQQGSSVAAQLEGEWCAEDLISLDASLRYLIERIDRSHIDREKSEIDTCVDGTNAKPRNGCINDISVQYHEALVDLLIYRHHRVLTFVVKYDDRSTLPIHGFQNLILFLKDKRQRFPDGKALTCISVAASGIPWLNHVSISGFMLHGFFRAVDRLIVTPEMYAPQEYMWNPELQMMACDYLFHKPYKQMFDEIYKSLKIYVTSESVGVKDQCVMVKDWDRIIGQTKKHTHDIVTLRVHKTSKQKVSFQNLQIQLLDALKRIGSIAVTGNHTAPLHLLCRLFHWVNLTESNETDWAFFCWLLAHRYRCVDAIDTLAVLNKRLMVFTSPYEATAGRAAGVAAVLREYLDKPRKTYPKPPKMPEPADIFFFVFVACSILPKKEFSSIELAEIWKAFKDDCASLPAPLQPLGDAIFKRQVDCRTVHALLHLLAFRYLLASKSHKSQAKFKVVCTKHLRQPVIQLYVGPHALMFNFDFKESYQLLTEALKQSAENDQPSILEATIKIPEALGLPHAYACNPDSILHKQMKDQSLSLDVAVLASRGVASIQTGLPECVKQGYELLVICYTLHPHIKRFILLLKFLPHILLHESNPASRREILDLIDKNLELHFPTATKTDIDKVSQQLKALAVNRIPQTIFTSYIDMLIDTSHEPWHDLAVDVFMESSAVDERAQQTFSYIQKLAEKQFKPALKLAEKFLDEREGIPEEWLPVVQTLGRAALRETSSAILMPNLCHLIELVRKLQPKEAVDDNPMNDCIYDLVAQFFENKQCDAAMQLMVTAARALQNDVMIHVGQSYQEIQTNAQDCTRKALKTLGELADAYYSETDNKKSLLYLQLFLELAKCIIQNRKNTAKHIFEECKKFLVQCNDVNTAKTLLKQFNDKELLIHHPASTLWIDYCHQVLIEQGTHEAVVAWYVGKTLKLYDKLNYGTHRIFLLAFLEKLYQSDEKEAQQLAEDLYKILNASKSFEIDPKIEAIAQKRKTQDEIENLFDRCRLGSAQQTIDKLLTLVDMDSADAVKRLRELISKWLPGLCSSAALKGSFEGVCDTLDRPKVRRLFQDHYSKFIDLCNLCLKQALAFECPPRDDALFRRLMQITLKAAFQDKMPAVPTKSRVEIVELFITLLNHAKKPKGLVQLTRVFRRCHEGLYTCLYDSRQPAQLLSLLKAFDQSSIQFTPSSKIVDYLLEALSKHPEQRNEIVNVIMRNWAYAQMAWSEGQLKTLRTMVTDMVKERHVSEAAILLEKILLPKYRKYSVFAATLGQHLYEWAQVFAVIKTQYPLASACAKELFKHFLPIPVEPSSKESIEDKAEAEDLATKSPAWPFKENRCVPGALLVLTQLFPEPVILLDPMLCADITLKELNSIKSLKVKPAQINTKKLHQQVKILVLALIENTNDQKKALELSLKLLQEINYTHDVLWYSVLKKIYASSHTRLKQEAWEAVKDRKPVLSVLKDESKYAEWCKLEVYIIRILVELFSSNQEDAFAKQIVARCKTLLDDQEPLNQLSKNQYREKALLKSLKALLNYAQTLLRKNSSPLPQSLRTIIKDLRNKLTVYLSAEQNKEQRKNVDFQYVKIMAASITNADCLDVYRIQVRLLCEELALDAIDKEFYTAFVQTTSVAASISDEAATIELVPLVKKGSKHFQDHLKKRFDPLFLADALSKGFDGELLLRANELFTFRLSFSSNFESLPRTLEAHPHLRGLFERITKCLIDDSIDDINDNGLLAAFSNLHHPSAKTFANVDTILQLHDDLLRKVAHTLLLSPNGIDKFLGDIFSFLKRLEQDCFSLLRESDINFADMDLKPVSRLSPLILELAAKVSYSEFSASNMLQAFVSSYLEYMNCRYVMNQDTPFDIAACRRQWTAFLERVQKECIPLSVTMTVRSGNRFSFSDQQIVIELFLSQSKLNENQSIFVICYAWFYLHMMLLSYQNGESLVPAELAKLMELFLLTEVANGPEAWPFHNAFVAQLFRSGCKSKIFDLYPDLYYKYSLFIFKDDKIGLESRGRQSGEISQSQLASSAYQFIGDLIQKRHPSSLVRASIIISKNTRLLTCSATTLDQPTEVYLNVLCRSIHDEWDKLLTSDWRAVNAFHFSASALGSCLEHMPEKQESLSLWKDIMKLNLRALKLALDLHAPFIDTESLCTFTFDFCFIPLQKQWLEPRDEMFRGYLKELHPLVLAWHHSATGKLEEMTLIDFGLRLQTHFKHLCQIHQLLEALKSPEWKSFIHQTLADVLSICHTLIHVIPRDAQAKVNLNCLELAIDCLNKASQSFGYVGRYDELMDNFLNWIPILSLQLSYSGSVVDHLYNLSETLIAENRLVQPLSDKDRRCRVDTFSSWMKAIHSMNTQTGRYFMHLYLHDARVIEGVFKGFRTELHMLRQYDCRVDDEVKISLDQYLELYIAGISLIKQIP